MVSQEDVMVDVEGLIRRLVLAGVPLMTIGCFHSSCDEPSPAVSRYAEVANPATVMDAGISRVTAASYQACADRLDCLPLCREVFSPAGYYVDSCARVATDGFLSADDRIAIEAEVVELCEGRRPEGQGAPAHPRHAGSAIGAYLARAAYLEGVSVPAFLRLGAELSAHGAPRPLIDAAARAARDEVRHHRMMTALARRFGAEPAELPRDLPEHVRPLEAIAIENAIEGCLRETVGALVADRQAAFAVDPAIRAASRAIARDEAGHAALAFAVDRWVRGELSPTAVQLLDAQLAAAATRLAREAAAAGKPVPAELTGKAGLPSRTSFREIVAGVTRTLGSAFA